jgi:hypothetical protein
MADFEKSPPPPPPKKRKETYRFTFIIPDIRAGVLRTVYTTMSAAEAGLVGIERVFLESKSVAFPC